MPARRSVAVVAAVVAVLAALTVTAPAGAVTEGACTARMASVDVGPLGVGATSAPIVVSKDQPMSVTMSAATAINHLKVELEFAGMRWTVHDRPSTGTSWASEVPVDDYATYGLGLYKVVSSASGPGLSCTGAALVEVRAEENLAPLATPAGIIGLALALFGAFGTLAIALKVGQSRVSPIAGGLLGAVFGLGIVVLLQQFAVLYPTLGVTGAIVALGAARRPRAGPLRDRREAGGRAADVDALARRGTRDSSRRRSG